MRSIFRVIRVEAFIILAICAAAGFDQPVHAADKPNFVFFLVDDMGWADIEANGSTFHETPNIDAFAQSGMRFTNGYAAASICSPTRASIMTGRHPVRVNITDWIPGSKTPDTAKFQHVHDRDNLALEETTIAEVLKEKANYTTFFAGKWHLGSEGFLPTDQGFDINIGGHDRGSPPGGYYAPWKNPYLKAKADDEYLTERLTEESIAFMKEQKDSAEPFLVYLSYYNIHTPIQPYKKHIDKFAEKARSAFPEPSPPIDERNATSRSRQDNAELASMVSAVDDSVGAILKSLDELKLADNTVVIFFSDNGGLCTRPAGKKGKTTVGPGCNLPLRAGKGWLYEGGIREPMIVRAPGITSAGSTCDTPVMSTDFFPSMLELAGLKLDPGLHADGESLLPLLKGETPDNLTKRALHWHYPHYHGSGWKPGGAIREGDWKLIEFWEYGDAQLFNLADDIGETNDLIKSNPDKAAELAGKLAAWRKDIGAVMPTLSEK